MMVYFVGGFGGLCLFWFVGRGPDNKFVFWREGRGAKKMLVRCDGMWFFVWCV